MLEFAWFLLERFRFQLLFVLGAIAFEVFVRTDLASRLLTKSYLLDLCYALFYRLGIFSILLIEPISSLVQANVAAPVFENVPLWVRALLYLVLSDFASYWIHRLGHAVPFFWAFHQVHHSVDQLTIMALYRTHPVDSWLRTVIAPTAFMILLGLPPALWLPLSIVWDIHLNLSHLEVNWTYGPFRWLFVSPVFHSVHHGIDGKAHQVNFGMGLSLWDAIFRTADHESTRPTVVGLPGWKVRESFLSHVWAPVRDVVRHYRGLPTRELAPLTFDSASPIEVAEVPIPSEAPQSPA